MALRKINKITGQAVYVAGDDTDTDRIIPARFMKCVSFDGLGQYSFYDERFDADGISRSHPLDLHRDASILIGDNNFGCGSSREHAPQALYHWGIRAVIAGSFAEIFYGNCTTLGIPCITLPADIRHSLHQRQLTIDLPNKTISCADCGKEYAFDISEAARTALIEGEWDPIAQLLANKDQIRELHAQLK